VLSLFPETATVEHGELSVGGLPTSELAGEFGTPLVVYCERTILDAARAYREAAPDALPLYSLKAFPNVALLRLLAAEGFGADVSTLGELAFARRAGIEGERIVVHATTRRRGLVRRPRPGALRRARRARRAERAAAAGVRRVLVRVTPESKRTRTRRSAPLSTARSSASRPTTRSGGRRRAQAGLGSRASTCTSARSCSTRVPASRRSTG
jgi:diaminopimelate decarboxylase